MLLFAPLFNWDFMLESKFQCVFTLTQRYVIMPYLTTSVTGRNPGCLIFVDLN